jgi:pimeloyl-ACP methyl ester carboxylesterase
MTATPTAHDVSGDGVTLNVWEQAPGDEAGEREAVVYVHGSITNARALFAPPVEGDDSYSWLAATAGTGRAAYAVDLRGYGDSDRPPEMDDPPEANGPPVRVDDAADDVRDVVAWVRGRGHDRVHLVGVSWGTMVCGRHVERDDPDLASLTQVAPGYRVPYDVDVVFDALGLDVDVGEVAYYRQEYDVVRERQGEVDDLFEAVWRSQVRSNQGVDGADAYVAQTGSLADWADASKGSLPYDAANVDVPTLVVRGSADAVSVREDALALYDELGVDGDAAEYAELAGADHYAMHGHRRRALYDAVAAFQGRV